MIAKTPQGDKAKVSCAARTGSFARRHSGCIIWGTLALTLLLLLPFFLLAPSQRASEEPGGEVFDLSDRVEERFPRVVHPIYFIVESPDGDVLTQKVLWDLYQNEEKLRGSELGKDFLYSGYDVASGQVTYGVFTIADAVELWFRAHPEYGVTLENASDEQVKFAIHHVLADPQASELKEWFSDEVRKDPQTFISQPYVAWFSPALSFLVNADNAKVVEQYSQRLPPGQSDIVVKEHFDREVQALLRGTEESYRLWGIGIDLTLESEDEGSTSMWLIIAAVLVILLVVTLHFRSLQVSLLAVLAVGMLIVWLKGLSNLIGLKASLITDIIVPVALLVLGVDYLIHSLHRYREEREKGAGPRTALESGIAGVGGALVLAMLTTVVAFMANGNSGIESMIGFGAASALGIICALVIMGLFLPTLKMRLDARGQRRGGKRSKKGVPQAEQGEERSRGRLLSSLVTAVADYRLLVLPLVLLLSGVALFFATRLEAKLDVKEFLDPRSDFVVSLDKMDEHIGPKAGEPALIYVEGDLTRPEALAAIKQLVANMDDDETVAKRTSDGKANARVRLFDFLSTVLEKDFARSSIEAANPGIRISDADGDGIPDSPGQLRAVYNYIVERGIPQDEDTLLYRPERIGEAFFHGPGGSEKDATLVEIGIPKTREQAVAKQSRDELIADMEALEGVEAISSFGLTGTAYERVATLDAITRSLSISIIIATGVVFLILLLAFRSPGYSIVTVIPVLLVASWLYAFMHLLGFHLNAITATIAALSIGVGIDYSVHLTARFRQELGMGGSKRSALERAAGHTGSALLGSATSTFLGFMVISFAPMPMFSSFGLLTAVMIAMALVAALFVLPGMLLLVSKDS